MQELQRSLLSAEKDLRALQAGRRTLVAIESQVLNICKRREGQGAVLVAELRASPAELADIASQCDGAHGHVNTALLADCDAAAASETTAIGNCRLLRSPVTPFLVSLLRPGVERVVWRRL